MLNLFIGMILDNFGFITDEIAQVEDDEWSNGSGAGQIDELANIFLRFSNRDGYMPVSSLEPLLEAFPSPMG